MIFQVFQISMGRQVATMESTDLASATSNARNQAQLFGRNPDDMFVCADPEPEPNAERDRFGFAWTDGGAGEGARP